MCWVRALVLEMTEGNRQMCRHSRRTEISARPFSTFLSYLQEWASNNLEERGIYTLYKYISLNTIFRCKLTAAIHVKLIT